MSLTEHKLTAANIQQYGVVAAPDKLTGTAQQNKKLFDRLIREVFAGDFNALIDELTELGVEKAALLPEGAGFKFIRVNVNHELEVSVDGTTWQVTGQAGEAADRARASAEAADNAKAAAETAQGKAEDAQEAAEAAQEAAYGSASAAAGSEAAAKDYAEHIADPVSGLVTTWLGNHITNPSNPPIDTSLSVAGAAADAAKVGELMSALNDSVQINEFANLNLVSGGIGRTGGLSTSNTRIRTNSGYPIEVRSGDFYWCDSQYQIRVVIYTKTTLTSANFVTFLNEFRSGAVYVPEEYLGKRAAVLIQKVGHESDDISSDLATISDHVKYFSPIDKLLPKYTLNSEDDCHAIKETGIYRWIASQTPQNAPETESTTMLVFTATDVNRVSQTVHFAVDIDGRAFVETATASGVWKNWKEIATASQIAQISEGLSDVAETLQKVSVESINLYDDSNMSSSANVNVTHNADGTVTLETATDGAYRFVSIPFGGIKANTTYQLSFEIISASANAAVSMRFVGTWTGETQLAGGIGTRHEPGVYRGTVYTSGYEKYLRLYITGSASASATVTVKSIMVAEADYPIPFVPYGVAADDKSARSLLLGARNERLSWGVMNTLMMARQFANVKYTPVRTLPSQFGDLPANQEIMGVIYSSARSNDRMIGNQVSLYTFLSAISNPRSVLYTRILTNSNAKTYYGCVCSALVNYAFGTHANYTTETLRDWPDLEEIPFTAISPGDIVVSSSHTRMITDVIRDQFGRITNVTTTEAGTPNVYETTSIPWASFLRDNADYKAYRYKYRDNVQYTYQPFVKGFPDETIENIKFPDIMPEYGDKVAILEGEDIVINVIDGTGYASISVYIDDVLSQTISNIADFTIPNAAPGKYKIVMSGNGKESVTEFIVVDADCAYDPSTHILTFGSGNASPEAVYVFDSTPTNHYVPLTAEQLQSGRVDLSDYITSEVKYAKVGFRTEFGVATWYSYDLHKWRYID